FVLFGLLDDAGIKIRARYKIFGHLLFSLIFVCLTGLSFNLFRVQPINCILTACFITFMTNSTNMLDGMDGLVTGVALWASLFFALIAFNNNMPQLTLLCLALSGACLGFLRYNFNPASIFLGECGSTLIGYLLAIFSLKLKIFKLWSVAILLEIPRLQFISFIIPLIILGIPIFDTFFVFINRFFNHIKMSTPGKDHSHHRIHLMGLSQKATVLTIYAVQIVLGAIALTMVNSDLQQFWALLLIAFVLAVFVWNFLLRVRVYSPDEAAAN
ncbi:MAG: MraY family glycosyltransferase, partial [bacterium]